MKKSLKTLAFFLKMLYYIQADSKSVKPMQRWLSGLRRTIGNRVRSKASGGSNPLLCAKRKSTRLSAFFLVGQNRATIARFFSMNPNFAICPMNRNFANRRIGISELLIQIRLNKTLQARDREAKCVRFYLPSERALSFDRQGDLQRRPCPLFPPIPSF